MVFFLGAESEAPASYLFFKMQKIIEPELNRLKDKNYGDELLNIGIISLIFQDDTYENRGHSERSIFHRRSKDADVRLRLNFKKFVYSSPEVRYDLYSQHIILSVETLRKKVSKSYRFEQLISDMTEVLLEARLKEACSSIKRLP